MANLEKEWIFEKSNFLSRWKDESLEQELVESKAKLENLTSAKPTVDNRSVSISLKPKAEKVYIPPFTRNNKENAYFARLDKGKSSYVDVEISKPKSKPIASV